MKPFHLFVSLTACALVACMPARVAFAQHEHGEPSQHAQHQAAEAAVAQLQLNGSAKWVTDASLREGMAGIRAAFDADHPAIHAGKQSDAAYAALATRIDQQVKSIVANCRLPAEADANLHFVIADLLQGVSIMRGEVPANSRHDGAAMVHQALNAYGRFFDDPTWKPDAPMQTR
jgi:hypothetical protein